MEQWGSAAALRLFIFLQIQAIAAFVLVLAVYLAASNTHVFPRVVDVIAMVVALGALAGEALSDAQLWKFRKTAAAKTVSAKPGCGVIPAIPTIFLNGFSGAVFRCWPFRGRPCHGYLSSHRR